MPTIEALPTLPGRPSLAAGGPQFRLRLGFFLVGCPDALARLGLFGRNALYLRRNAVERTREAHAPAFRLVGPALAGLRDYFVRFLEARVEDLVDLVVRNLDAELIGDRIEEELAGDGGHCLLPKSRDEVLGGVAGELQVGLERAAASVHHPVELAQERARPRVDERPRDAYVRGLDEPVERRAAECLVHLCFDLRAQAPFDVGPQVVERVELRGRTGELVVERRKHLFLDLLHNRLDLRRLRSIGALELNVSRLTARHADQLFLELRHQPPRPEFDDVVALAGVVREEIYDHRVAGLCGPILDRRQPRHGRAKHVQLVLDEVCGHLRLHVGHLQLRPVGRRRLREHRHGCPEAPVLVVRRRQLVFELGLVSGPDAAARDGIPVPRGDVALDRLRVEPLLSDAGEQDRQRHLALAEAGDLDARGEVRRRVLDGVVDVLARYVDRQPDLVLGQLLYLSGHAAIRPEGRGPAAPPYSGCRGSERDRAARRIDAQLREARQRRSLRAGRPHAERTRRGAAPGAANRAPAPRALRPLALWTHTRNCRDRARRTGGSVRGGAAPRRHRHRRARGKDDRRLPGVEACAHAPRPLSRR